MKKFLKLWQLYEAATKLREEAETVNSAEQQAYIEPLFIKAFPALSAQGITYSTSWQCDDEEEAIAAWEKEMDIDAYCSKIAAKNAPLIDELKEKEREAERNVVNAALDMLENDAKSKSLTDEEKQRVRGVMNTEGYNRDRVKFLEQLKKLADSIK